MDVVDRIVLEGSNNVVEEVSKSNERILTAWYQWKGWEYLLRLRLNFTARHIYGQKWSRDQFEPKGASANANSIFSFGMKHDQGASFS